MFSKRKSIAKALLVVILAFSGSESVVFSPAHADDLSDVNTKIANATSQLTAAQTALTENSLTLITTQSELITMKAEMADQARALQVNGGRYAFIQSILSARSLTEAAQELSAAATISQAESRQMAALQAQQNKVAAEQRTQKTLLSTIQSQLNALGNQKDQVLAQLAVAAQKAAATKKMQDLQAKANAALATQNVTSVAQTTPVTEKKAATPAVEKPVTNPVVTPPVVVTPTPPAATGSVYEQFLAAGGTADMWTYIVMPESGGNPDAVSPNGYHGLGQTMQSWGYGSVANQTAGMIAYAISVYGSIDNAVAFRRANNAW